MTSYLSIDESILGSRFDKTKISRAESATMRNTPNDGCVVLHK